MTEPSAQAPEPRHVRLWREGRLALDLVGRPGILASTSAPPPLPGQPPATHPFATATAYIAEWEGQLGTMLRGAVSLDDFLAAATDAGYAIEDLPGNS